MYGYYDYVIKRKLFVNIFEINFRKSGKTFRNMKFFTNFIVFFDKTIKKLKVFCVKWYIYVGI